MSRYLLLFIILLSGCSRATTVTFAFSDGHTSELTDGVGVDGISIDMVSNSLDDIKSTGVPLAVSELAESFKPELRLKRTYPNDISEVWFITKENAVQKTYDDIYLCWRGRFEVVVGMLRKLSN